jgi:nucleoside-diphosphate-sugar epimerase
MTRVVVTGASGFVGRTLCPMLAASGHEVNAITRHMVPEIGPDTDWSAALAGAGAVVHLAARVHVTDDPADDPLAAHRHVNTLGTRRLAEAAVAAGVRRMVFASTIKVNGENTEAEPFRATDAAAPRDPYGISKWEAEQALFRVAGESAMEAVVLRPPLVYGPGVGGNFLSLLRVCAKAPPLPLAMVANRRSLIHVGNLADAILRCLDHPEAAGRTFLVSDGETVSTPELVRRVAAALGRPARLFPVPPQLLRLAGRLTGKSSIIERLLDSLAVDDGEIRRRLDWKPPFSMSRGLQETAAWFTSHSGRNEG